MKLILDQIGKFRLSKDFPDLAPNQGDKLLRVLYCGICRTDAKMWSAGHRDLELPRVLGHEIAAIDDETGILYTVWPGQICHSCWYCRNGRENLCETIQIIGFHRDGGFAHHIQVPEFSLLAAPPLKNSYLLCLTEPLGCILHGLKHAGNLSGKKIIIYGGGLIGLLAGYICQHYNAEVRVVEKSAEKIDKSSAAIALAGLSVKKTDNESDFDVALNCCDSPAAFSNSILKLKKGGKLIFFSGLLKNSEIDTNILNLLHYRESEVYGSYGLAKNSMERALALLCESESFLQTLVERIIFPHNAEKVMDDVLTGKSLKYIINFQKQNSASDEDALSSINSNALNKKASNGQINLSKSCRVKFSGRDIHSKARHKIDCKTKPLGALGKLEDLAVQIACIQNSLTPQINEKKLLVFAADHGVAEEGISAYPAKVTAQMVQNFLNGGAAINCFCTLYGIDLSIIDMGVNRQFDNQPALIDKKIGCGTDNFLHGPAMSKSAAGLARDKGIEVVAEAYAQNSFEVVGIGEMGIGNTTSATAIIAAITGVNPEDIVGRGTGIDNAGLKRKVKVILKALDLHSPNAQDPIDIISKIGGFEIAGMCGAILKAAELNCVVVLDGLISTTAGLLAYLHDSEVRHFLIAGHQSVEKAQKHALDYMGINSLVNLDMRLGEGTGAAIAINLCELSCRLLNEMASFDEAGIDNKSR